LGQSTGSKAARRERRLSAAHEALSSKCEEGMDKRNSCIGDAPGSADDVQKQRRWWAEQRQFLLEDLYPAGTTCLGVSPGSAVAWTPGQPPQTAELPGNADEQEQAQDTDEAWQQQSQHQLLNQRAATVAPAVAHAVSPTRRVEPAQDTDDAQQQQPQPREHSHGTAKAAPAAALAEPPPRREVRNLSALFEHVEEDETPSPHSQEPPTPAAANGLASSTNSTAVPRKSEKVTAAPAPESRLRQPQFYFRNRRQSMSSEGSSQQSN